MAFHWMRRVGLLAACATALLLAACGGGSVYSQFSPDRVIAFGDAMADLGQNGSRYTVNDGSLNNWIQYVAGQYNHTIAASSQGGLGYGWGNARVSATPDAAGNSSTPTVTQQIDTFLASHSVGSNDLLLVSAGTSDVIVQARMALEGTQTSDQMTANLDQADRQLGEQLKRLVAAGGKHVVVAGPVNLGRSPWAVQLGSDSLLQSATTAFNNGLLVSLVDQGANVLYVDAALYFNQQTGSTTNVKNHTDAVCTSVDPGPGIGTGNGQVNSNLCTTGTILPTANYGDYLWADRAYPTPRGHQLFGDYAYGRIHQRW